jgi:type IV pilus assembly protein PilZ
MGDVEDSPGLRQSMLNLTIKTTSALYASFMPFLKNGGLFIPTNKRYELGDEVFVLLTLLEEPERIPIAGRVVWITPQGAEGNRAVGVGVQFSDQDEDRTRRKIEDHLVGVLGSDRPTHTL